VCDVLKSSKKMNRAGTFTVSKEVMIRFLMRRERILVYWSAGR